MEVITCATCKNIFAGSYHGNINACVSCGEWYCSSCWLTYPNADDGSFPVIDFWCNTCKPNYPLSKCEYCCKHVHWKEITVYKSIKGHYDYTFIACEECRSKHSEPKYDFISK